MSGYPSTKTTFSDPSGTTLVDTGVDHAALHTSINDTVEVLEDTVGTTAGTNVLKNFAAGDFPARINSSNVLQQVITGTVNTTVGTLSGAVIGTPAITGGTATGMVVMTPTFNNTIAGSAIATGAEVTTGTDNTKIVTPKSIGDAAVNTRLQSKIVTATRDLSTASGDVAYTGAGFKPTSVACVYGIANNPAMGYGFGDSALAVYTTAQCYINTGAGNSNQTTRLIFVQPSEDNHSQDAIIKSYDNDGMTLTWTKTGDPSSVTINIAFIFYK